MDNPFKIHKNIEKSSNNHDKIKTEHNEFAIETEENSDNCIMKIDTYKTIKLEIGYNEPDDEDENHYILETQHRCHLCNLGFSTESLYQQHVDCFHTQLKEDRCNMCDFNTNYSTMNDEEEHLKKFECNLCDHKFVKSQHLELHKQLIHNSIEVINFYCENCFQRGHKMRNRLNKQSQYVTLVQTVSEPYEDMKIEYDELTIKKEYNESQLNLQNQPVGATVNSHHQEIVKQEMKDNEENLESCVKETVKQEPFRCNTCDLNLGYKKIYERHMQSIHAEEFKNEVYISYQCKLCDFESKNRRYWLKHKRTKHKKLECEICKHEFPKLSKLKSHIKHFHDKPYKVKLKNRISFKTKAA